MSKAQTYRQYASQCLSLAQSIDDPNDKATLLHMAETWRHLAERAEKNTDPPDHLEEC